MRKNYAAIRILSWIFFLLMLFNGESWGQTTIFTENMGTPTSTTTIAANTFQNSTSSLTYSNGSQTNSADVRNTNTSSGYTGSSAGGNVFFTSTSGSYGFSIESINASGYLNLQLSYGYRKESTSLHAAFSVEYYNGSSWVTIANTSGALFNESATASTGWYAAKNLNLPVGAQISGLKIRFVKTGTASIRIDDVVLTGTLNPSIALSSPTIPTSAINNNTNNNIVGAVQMAVTTADATLNSATFTTAGTYTASDIATNGFKFWLSSSATDISGATQLGSAQAAAGTGSNISVSGLNSSITSGTTRFIVLAADIAASPTNGATIGITSTAHSNITFASGTKTGTDPVAAGTTRSISVATPDITLSSPVSSSANLTQGLTNQEIYRFDLAVTTATATLNGVTINTAGTYTATDITNIKCWYSADNTFNSSSDELLSTKTTSIGTGTHVFPTFTSKTISSGSTGYIFITVDLPLTAAENNTISINAITNSDISFLSGNKTGTANASGTKTIVACTPTNVTGLSATAGNGTLTISWTNPSCLDEIMMVAKPTSNVTTNPTGDGSSYTSNLSFGNGGASAFDGTGFVVYKGTSSPQTITGLTNGTNYFIEVFTRKSTTWSSGSEVSATPNVNTYTYGTSTTSTAWANASNWTGGPTNTYPGIDAYSTSIADGLSSDIASFSTLAISATPAAIGLNFGNTTGNNGVSNNSSFNQSLTLGAIHFASISKAITLGKSDGSTGGANLTLTGARINSVDNVVIRHNTATHVATITQFTGGSGSAMQLTLANSANNIIRVDNSGNLTISCAISSSSGPLTIAGSGTGVVEFSGQNNYSNITTISGSTLRLNRTGGTTLPATNDVTINGGVFRVSTNQTLNNLTFTSGELIVDAGVTLTINGTLSYTTGTFTINGNIAYGASSTVLFQNASGLNLPASFFTNNPFNVTLNGVGGATLGGNTKILGTLTLTSGTLTVGANTLTLDGSISRTSGNIDASNATATVVFSGSSSQSIPDGTFTGNINNLTVNNSNGLTNNQSVIISGTLTLTAGVFDANNVTTLNSTSSLIYNGGSMINYTIPTSLNNFTLPTGTTALSNDISLSGNLNLGSNTLDIGSNTLTINGDITRTTGSIKTNGGKLILEGTSSSTLHFDQTTDGTTNKLKDLTINRTGATVTLGNKLQIAHNGTVTVTAGTLAASGNLVLTSTLGGTARIAELAAGAAVSGNVEIQRYMVGGASSQRGWRYMSSPVASSTYAQLIDDIFITGPGGASNGFDWTGNSSSVMTYEESSSRGWKNITSPSNTWNPGKGAIVFFRGDRTQTSSITNTNVAPNSFALDYSGNINSGSFTINLDYDNTTGVAANQGWNLIGNPYPSQIDWDLVTKTSGVNSHYYLINPTSKNYLSANTGIIAIGQGFFVQVNASGQSVSFEENDKTSSNGTAYFKTATNPITIKMHLDSVQNDVAKIFFVTGASKNYLFTEDAIKLNNAVYNLSIVTPNNIDVQNSYVPHLGNTGTDTFELKVTSTTNTSYYLSFDNFAQIPSGKAILLLDKQNNSITNLRLNGNYQFAINNSQSSSFGNRFLLIITDQHNSLPLKLTQFSGASKGLTNELTWVTVSEKNIIGFEVQKSDYGFDFETIGFVKANNQQSTSKYLYTDNQSKNTKVYYRLKINERNLVTFSHVVVLNNELQQNLVNQLQVFPNPAQNSLSINLIDNNNIGKIYVFDLFGKLMQQHDGVSQIDVSKLSSGSYIIQVEVNDITYRVKFTKN